MSQFNPSGLQTFTAGGAIAQHLRVSLTAGKLAVADVGANDFSREVGTIMRAVFADGELATVRLRNMTGTRKVVADGVIARGAPIYGGAVGTVSATVSGGQWGIAIEPATAAGDVIEVMSI